MTSERFNFGSANTSSHATLALLTGSTNWESEYAQLFEGPPPKSMKKTMSELKTREYSPEQWSEVQRMLNPVSIEQKFPLSKINTEKEFEDLKSFKEQLNLPDITASLLVKMYLTVCQPNYENLLPCVDGVKLKYDTKQKIREIRSESSLTQTFGPQRFHIMHRLIN